MASGVAALLLGAVALVVLLVSGAPRGTRLLLLPIFWFGALGVFQARART